jgi:predicted PurR-regulated permease PerM
MIADTPTPLSVPSTSRDWRRLVLIELAFLLVAAFIWLAWQLMLPISHTVLLFLLGIAFAFVLYDPSRYLARRLGGKRMLGILVAYLIAFAIVIGALLLLAAPFVQELTKLDIDLPNYIAQAQAQSDAIDQAAASRGIQLNLSSGVAQSGPALQQSAHTVLHDVIGVASAIGDLVMNAVLILVVSAYVLTGVASIQGNVRRAVPVRYRGVHHFVQSSAARVMGSYLRGQLIMAGVIGTLAATGTGLLGLPNFIVLGVLAGMFELVPMFGPILSAIPAVIVALFQPWPTVVWVILFFIVIQQFESNVLGPKIQGHAVGLHPLGAMFALMVGFELAGLLGGLFAVPVAGVIWVLVSTTYKHYVDTPPLAEATPEAAVEPTLLETADGAVPAD